MSGTRCGALNVAHWDGARDMLWTAADGTETGEGDQQPRVAAVALQMRLPGFALDER